MRKYWVVTMNDGMEVSGPYGSESSAKAEAADRQAEVGVPLIVINSDDAY